MKLLSKIKKFVKANRRDIIWVGLYTLLMLSTGFYLGRSTNTISESKTVLKRLETVSIDVPDDKLKPIEVIKVKNIEKLPKKENNQIDTSVIIEDYNTIKKYEIEVINSDTVGKVDVKAEIFNNSLKDLIVDVQPIVKETTIIKERKIIPHINLDYSTLHNTVGVGAGVMINKVDLNYRFQLDPNNKQTGHMIGIGYRF